MSGYAQQTPSKKTGRNVRCNIFGVNCLKCAHKQAKTILHINGAGSYRGGRRGKHDSPRDFRRPVFCSSSVQNHYWAPQSPFGRGENLWFHHDTILYRFIGQRYDICRYQKSAAIRFWFRGMRSIWDDIICPFNTTSYNHINSHQLNYNFIILFLCSSGYLKQKNQFLIQIIKCHIIAFKCQRFFMA